MKKLKIPRNTWSRFLDIMVEQAVPTSILRKLLIPIDDYYAAAKAQDNEFLQSVYDEQTKYVPPEYGCSLCGTLEKNAVLYDCHVGLADACPLHQELCKQIGKHAVGSFHTHPVGVAAPSLGDLKCTQISDSDTLFIGGRINDEMIVRGFFPKFPNARKKCYHEIGEELSAISTKGIDKADGVLISEVPVTRWWILSWDKPEDNERLRDLLVSQYNIPWADKAHIRKTKDESSLIVTDSTHELIFKLDFARDLLIAERESAPPIKLHARDDGRGLRVYATRNIWGATRVYITHAQEHDTRYLRLFKTYYTIRERRRQL